MKCLQVDPVDAVRHDKDACGGFSVGRHAQVLFDGGIWYVGVVAQVGGAIGPGDGRGTGGGEGLRLLFEDGDEVITHTAAADVILLPSEWSDSVSQSVWGWWGYNADRVERSKDPPPPPPVVEDAGGGDSKGKKRRRSGSEPKVSEKEVHVDKKKKIGGGAGGEVVDEVGEKKKKAGGGGGGDKWPWWHIKVPNPWGGVNTSSHTLCRCKAAAEGADSPPRGGRWWRMSFLPSFSDVRGYVAAGNVPLFRDDDPSAGRWTREAPNFFIYFDLSMMVSVSTLALAGDVACSRIRIDGSCALAKYRQHRRKN